LVQIIYSLGSLVALKVSLMAVALGLFCYFDYLDSDGIVG